MTCTAIRNPQEDDILQRTYQVFGSMINTKDLANITFDAVAP